MGTILLTEVLKHLCWTVTQFMNWKCCIIFLFFKTSGKQITFKHSSKIQDYIANIYLLISLYTIMMIARLIFTKDPVQNHHNVTHSTT